MSNEIQFLLYNMPDDAGKMQLFTYSLNTGKR